MSLPTAATSATMPLRVAIFGSGPSGFYTVEALFKQTRQAVLVDMFDRLPVPFGLVRYGVAPDHQNIKAVIKVYEKLAADARFRFFGNVALGEDLTLDEVLRHYDQVVLTTGCASDKRMGIPEEDASGSYAATDFVAWYNGHPDYRDLQFALDHERVAVVGVGNVAMDVTRILLKDRDQLATSDIENNALAALRQSRVREVVLLGRRGPAQAAFSNKEIREIGELDDVAIDIDSALLENVAVEGLDKDARKNIEYFRELAAAPVSNKAKRVTLRFLTSPIAIVSSQGKVAGLKIERNRLHGQGPDAKASGTGEFETLAVGAVFRSIGYRGVPIPGLPFDDKTGLLPNREGRVLTAVGGEVLPRVYCAGWIKRGPSGLVGSNKPDAAATVAQMLADLDRTPLQANRDVANADVADLLQAKNVRAIGYDDWRRLDELELERGKAKGKVREKFSDLRQIFAALDAATPLA